MMSRATGSLDGGRIVSRSRTRALTLVVVAIPIWTACGSGGAPAQSKAPAALCSQVAAVLSDGPDPGADPVGYALAQVRPLRQIDTSSDTSLQVAVDDLAAAYQNFSAHNGKTSSAQHALNRAVKSVDTLCPGAGAAT